MTNPWIQFVRRRRSLGGGFSVGAALWLAACSPPPEAQLLNRFFRATQQEDRTTIAGASLVSFPGERVLSWELVESRAETEGPYRIPELREEVASGEARRDEQFQQFYVFRQANQEALEAVDARRERNPEAAIGGRLGVVAAAWDEHRAERRRLVTALSEAQIALEAERRRAQRSLLREAPVDYLTGSIRERELLVRVDEEGSGPRDYRFTLLRYDLVNQFGSEVPARWVIVGIEPAADGG